MNSPFKAPFILCSPRGAKIANIDQERGQVNIGAFHFDARAAILEV